MITCRMKLHAIQECIYYILEEGREKKNTAMNTSKAGLALCYIVSGSNAVLVMYFKLHVLCKG